MKRIAVVITLVVAARIDGLAMGAEGPLPKIGELWFEDLSGAAPFHGAFLDGLRALGYIEEKNVVLLTRYANGDEAGLPSLVRDLIARNVDVLFVSQKAVSAAKRLVPIVCATMDDPVREGIVASLSKPGGNVTGLSWQTVDTSAKRLELTNEFIPSLRRVAVLFDSEYAGATLEAEALHSAAQSMNILLREHGMRGPGDLQSAFERMVRDRAQALIVVDSALTTNSRGRIGKLAAGIRIPWVSEGRHFAEAGSVLTYGASLKEMLARGARYVDKILKGAKPGDLPIEQPNKFELVVNLKTAKALGITMPGSILLRADEVIR